jgi:hypothetical protein
VSVQFPYRAVICGEEHIVKGWRGRKLLTDKGSFSVRHFYGDWPIQNHRLFEVATVQSDRKGGWLVNGRPLSLLKSLPFGLRLTGIPSDETLRVNKDKICAAAWFQVANLPNVTELLDGLEDFWKQASQPSDDATSPSERLALSVINLFDWKAVAGAWSKPVWLTECRHAPQTLPVSPQQKQLARVVTELSETKAQLRKVEATASDTLKEALLKWMRFDPPRMSVPTKAKIEKAVRLYSTDPDKRSLAKIAAEFGVSRKTVSGWLHKFQEETGFPVITHRRHESVREHLKAHPMQDEED